jgi:homoserine acetyltransferase
MCADFLIETYLDHQGEKFCLQYDANSLLYISKAMDLFDMTRCPSNDRNQSLLDESTNEIANTKGPTCSTTGSNTEKSEDENWNLGKQDIANNLSERQQLVLGMSKIQAPALVLGVQSDILFPVWQQKEIADCLREAGNQNVTYYELDAIYGHDTFLIDFASVGSAIKGHLEKK